MQNVFEMSEGTRGAFESALDNRPGGRGFRVRLERHFADLYEPLERLYGDHPAFADAARGRASSECRRARRRAAGRCARSTTSARSRPTGSSASGTPATSATPTASPGRSPACASGCRTCRELGVTYLHLMPLLRSRPGENDGGYAVADYREVEPALGTMDDLRAPRRRSARAGHEPVRRPRDQPHGARARVGAAGDGGGGGVPRLLPDVPGSHRARRLRAHAAAGVPGLQAVELHVVGGARPLGLDHVQRVPVGPRLREPGASSPRCSGTCSSLANAGVDVLRLDAVPFMWKRLGTDCQNQPEVHDLLAGLPRGGADRGARGDLQGRGDRLARRRSSDYLGRVRAGVPQLADGAAVEQPGEPAHGADGPDAARRCPTTPAGTRLDHLPALPRRHRLGDHRGQRGRGWGRTRTSTASSSSASISGDFWESFARGAVFQPEFNGEGRTSGMAASLAGLDGGARGRRRGGDRPRRPPRYCCSTASCSPTAACRSSTWATRSGCATTPGYVDDPERRATTAGCTARWMDWEAAERRHDPAASRAGCSPACGR